MQIHPKAIEVASTYLLKNLIDRTETTVSGEQLSSDGISATLESEKAVVWHYSKV